MQAKLSPPFFWHSFGTLGSERSAGYGQHPREGAAPVAGADQAQRLPAAERDLPHEEGRAGLGRARSSPKWTMASSSTRAPAGKTTLGDLIHIYLKEVTDKRPGEESRVAERSRLPSETALNLAEARNGSKIASSPRSRDVLAEVGEHFRGQGSGRRSILDPELRVDLFEMLVHGSRAERQDFRDVFIGLSAPDPNQDLGLT